MINANGDIAWYGYDAGNDFEIYLYNALTLLISQVTDNTTHDNNPMISDNGDIVWTAWDETYSDSHIYLL